MTTFEIRIYDNDGTIMFDACRITKEGTCFTPQMMCYEEAEQLYQQLGWALREYDEHYKENK